MRDIWAFLLQTLTASGAAVLVLVVKAMLRDKLPPRWQFAVWGVLGAVLVLPAGLFGHYALFNWPFIVEAAKTLLSGEYTLTRVTTPFPLPPSALPRSLWDVLFLLYLLGAVVLLLRYLISYLRLRRILHQGKPLDGVEQDRLNAVAQRYNLPLCPAVSVPGLPSAFICGVFRPILVLPSEHKSDDKVLLHELLHLKYRDAAWGIVICLLRCIHWCNPFLWYCADQAGNDLEALCDQRVLERLEGEERRDYGRILLSMVNQKYARAPGTSSMANGGRNISRRIEAITRFKRFPAGMGLASACVALILAAPLLLGTRAWAVYGGDREPASHRSIDLSLASARTIWCTTPAGALDAYGKSLLVQSGPYRAMCAPMDLQAEIAAEMHQAEQESLQPRWDTGLPAWPDQEAGYAIYNLEHTGNNTYEGWMVVKLNYPPDGQPYEENQIYLAIQQVSVTLEQSRWVVLPLEPFQVVQTTDCDLNWGCEALPSYVFADEAADFQVELRLQKVFEVDNTLWQENGFFGSYTRFDLTPKPNASFSTVYWNQYSRCIYLGTESDKASITSLGLTSAPMQSGKERPVLRSPVQSSGSSSTGELWCGRTLIQPWGPDVLILMDGGGSGHGFDRESFSLPDYYAADLYINGARTAEMELRLRGEELL